MENQNKMLYLPLAEYEELVQFKKQVLDNIDLILFESNLYKSTYKLWTKDKAFKALNDDLIFTNTLLKSSQKVQIDLKNRLLDVEEVNSILLRKIEDLEDDLQSKTILLEACEKANNSWFKYTWNKLINLVKLKK